MIQSRHMIFKGNINSRSSEIIEFLSVDSDFIFIFTDYYYRAYFDTFLHQCR